MIIGSTTEAEATAVTSEPAATGSTTEAEATAVTSEPAATGSTTESEATAVTSEPAATGSTTESEATSQTVVTDGTNGSTTVSLCVTNPCDQSTCGIGIECIGLVISRGYSDYICLYAIYSKQTTDLLYVIFK